MLFRSNFLRTVFGISNPEYQKRVWIKGIGPESDDFDEATVLFFELGALILKDPKKFKVTDSQYVLLKTLWHAFSSFCDKPDLSHCIPEQFIDTPEWIEITRLATDLIKSFNYHYDFLVFQGKNWKENHTENT